jgi:capsule biosynthesis phosphatase
MTTEGNLAGTRLLVDVDGTLAFDDSSLPYCKRLPRHDVIARVNDLHARGVRIIIYSARNMRTYSGNLGLINKNTLPVLLSWLDRHEVKFDEIHMGKPWCGTEGFYVRDSTIRPDQFVSLAMDEIRDLLVDVSGAQ